LHVGGARTALFNWLVARAAGGVFVLRIEDTDRERSSPAMTQAILEGMSWLGLDWDEGPYHQADGLERHIADAGRLLANGRAYRCFCSMEQLEERRRAAGGTDPHAFRYDRLCLRSVTPAEGERRATAGEPHTVRFHVPTGQTEWDDAVHGTITFANDDIEDFVILRSDGTTIYNLAVVSDDVAMHITHVIRGDDHVSNTPKQILLYEALEQPVPRFAHVPMILGMDGKRLSKRHGATAIGEYRAQGILPDAMVNFLALLGWSSGTDEEVFSRVELVQRFSVEAINKKSAVFDPQKLAWMNGQHIARMSATELEPLVIAAFVDAGVAEAAELHARGAWLHELIDLLKTRARTIGDFARWGAAYLSADVLYDEDAVAKHWKDADATAVRLAAVHVAFAAVTTWSDGELEAALRAVAERLGVGAGKLIHPLRVALLGQGVSPGIFEVAVVLGHDQVLARLERARDRVAART
ncbi:MAG: glutamate--tRNA ligase, partial [Longimicrobiales bacterium]